MKTAPVLMSVVFVAASSCCGAPRGHELAPASGPCEIVGDPAAAPEVTVGEPDAEVEETLDAFHRAAATGDEDRYFAILPEDAVFLGTDPGERWTGVEFKKFAMPYFQRDAAWIYEPTERWITVPAGGRWAYFDEMLHNDAYGTCRGSGVCERRAGGWVILQYNLSIPVPNDLAGDLVARIRAMAKKK